MPCVPDTVLGKATYGTPYFLTEHGIYTHERDIEIMNADWIYSEESGYIAKEETTFFKKWWSTLFKVISSLAYEYADVISTLYRGNQLKQIEYGANPTKLSIIPNGIRLDQFDYDFEKAEPGTTIGLVGRVVPIKDIKGFIKAVKIVSDAIPNLKALIMGPTDEDEDYFKECESLVQFMGLQHVIEFTGRINVKEYYPKLDLNILSSISEGQPMVIQEAYAYGVPTVSTDVGGCREMIYGLSEEDRSLGQSGEVVPLGKPKLLAKAIIHILSNKDVWKAMSIASKERVSQFYREEDIIQRYHDFYQKLMVRDTF